MGRVGHDASDSKSNRLHVDIFRFCFHSFEVYSIDSSKMINKFSEVLNFNWVCLELQLTAGSSEHRFELFVVDQTESYCVSIDLQGMNPSTFYVIEGISSCSMYHAK